MLHTKHEHKCKETELLTKQLRCLQNWKILYFNNCIQHLLCFSITGKIFKKYTAHNADALDIMWFIPKKGVSFRGDFIKFLKKVVVVVEFVAS